MTGIDCGPGRLATGADAPPRALMDTVRAPTADVDRYVLTRAKLGGGDYQLTSLPFFGNNSKLVLGIDVKFAIPYLTSI